MGYYQFSKKEQERGDQLKMLDELRQQVRHIYVCQVCVYVHACMCVSVCVRSCVGACVCMYIHQNLVHSFQTNYSYFAIFILKKSIYTVSIKENIFLCTYN